ncbi:MAG TPA: glycosyl hydrolase family 18 protein [Candidatus Dormibacteraeota bacterium]|nr:glycosyl hydrolase family 18 protein [Candidatus Dormibacteraeota bacterium]
MRRSRLRGVIAAVGAASVFFSLPAGASAASTTSALPAHVYAPYFETWTTDGITATAQASGVKYMTLAFLESQSKTSCTVGWNGADPLTKYGADIASLRAAGGDVIPSFGGWSADEAGTEVGDSCKDVATLAGVYENVVTTLNVTRLDMDVEGRSLNRLDGIDRRNKALKMAEDWAAANGRTLQVSYTLPTNANGPDSASLYVLQNAVANGTRFDVANIMTFDYYDGVTTDMGGAAIAAAQGLFSDLQTLYPSKTSAQLWAMEGNTIMNGIDDYPKKTEVTYPADAQRLLTFAQSVGIGSLSMWAIQRDNGGCPGARGKNNCSGIAQGTWDFSHILETYS